jgi:hypothetical protein
VDELIDNHGRFPVIPKNSTAGTAPRAVVVAEYDEPTNTVDGPFTMTLDAGESTATTRGALTAWPN